MSFRSPDDGRADPARIPRGGAEAVAGLALLLGIVTCVDSGTSPLPGLDNPACALPDVTTDTVVIDQVSLVSYERGTTETKRAVRVVQGRIAAVDSAGAFAVTPGVTWLPGCDRFLVPGLADMHVHLSRGDLPAYLDAGVTTVRNLWGFPDLLAMQAGIEDGMLEGPTIHVVSSGLDGTPAKWPLTQFVLTAGDADSVVVSQEALGYRTLKLYADLTPEAFDAIVRAAEARGIAFGGHVPRRVDLLHALGSGYRFVEHLTGYDRALDPQGRVGVAAWRSIDTRRVPALVAATVQAGTWNTPTLAIFALLSNQDPTVLVSRRSLVRALHDAGAPLLLGTDAGIGQTAPGTSIHDEIDEFISAGIAPREVLRLATVEAARFLGQEGEFGRILPGLRADLLLVDRDPVADPRVLRQPTLVMARGRRVR